MASETGLTASGLPSVGSIRRIICRITTRCKGELGGLLVGAVCRAADTSTASIEDMGVDHCGLHVVVPQQFLHGPDVVALLQEMRRKRMAKRMAGCPFRDSRPEHSLPKCTLHDCLVHVVAVMVTSLPIPKIGLRRKNPLQCPLLFCGGDLSPLNGTASRERIWGWSKPREATNATRKEGTG